MGDGVDEFLLQSRHVGEMASCLLFNASLHHFLYITEAIALVPLVVFNRLEALILHALLLVQTRHLDHE